MLVPSSLAPSRLPARGIILLTTGKDTLRHTQRCMSWVIPNPAKWTRKIRHHTVLSPKIPIVPRLSLCLALKTSLAAAWGPFLSSDSDVPL